VNQKLIEELIAHLGFAGNRVTVLNPTTGLASHELPQLNAEQVKTAVSAARDNAHLWSSVTPAKRSKVLYRLHDLILENQDELMSIVQHETGKVRAHAFEEIAGGAGAARYYAKVGPKALHDRTTHAGVPLITKTYVTHVPLGVVGVITPWNYPLALCLLDVIPALMAGNAVVQKADNQTALTALYCRNLAIAAGLPETAWTIVVGDGAEVGNALTDTVDYIAFTGSTATGRLVASRAASRLIGYSLELGGKNPMIILPNADLAEAAEMLIGGAFGSAGQLCVSIERVYVHESVKAEFTAILAKKVESLKVGFSEDFTMDVGTLTSAAQLARVDSFVQDAVSTGATLVTGGKPLPEAGPFFYAPTVLTDVSHAAKLDRQEVFGPVIAVYGYATLAEAVALANDTEYGLNASVVGNKHDAKAVADQIMAGTVNINEAFRATFASLDTPMGGMKASGMGRRNGVNGLLKYTDVRAVGVHRGLLEFPSRGAQYNRMAPLLNLLSRIMRRLP